MRKTYHPCQVNQPEALEVIYQSIWRRFNAGTITKPDYDLISVMVDIQQLPDYATHYRGDAKKAFIVDGLNAYCQPEEFLQQHHSIREILVKAFGSEGAVLTGVGDARVQAQAVASMQRGYYSSKHITPEFIDGFRAAATRKSEGPYPEITKLQQRVEAKASACGTSCCGWFFKRPTSQAQAASDNITLTKR